MADLLRGPLYLDVDAVARVLTLDYPGDCPVASLTHLSIGDEGIDRITHQAGTWWADRSAWWPATDQARRGGPAGRPYRS